jgi:hypothetical protein
MGFWNLKVGEGERERERERELAQTRDQKWLSVSIYFLLYGIMNF